MHHAKYVWVLLTLAAIVAPAQEAVLPGRQVHQAPDMDGVYYVGPEVTTPRLIRTVYVTYPEGVAAKDVQGMTVLAMVIGDSGIPAHIQVLHEHGGAFDQASIAAVKQSVFEPGRLGTSPFPYGSMCELSSTPTAARPFLRSSSPREICLCRMHRNLKTSITSHSRTQRPSPSTRLTRTSLTLSQKHHLCRWPSFRSQWAKTDCRRRCALNVASGLDWTRRPRPLSGITDSFPPQRRAGPLPPAER